MTDQVDIPDEAWRGVLDFGIDGVLETVEAATPVIARAAQVAVLREVCGDIGRQADDTRHDDTIESSVLERVYGQIRARIITLEAGGGQTDEVPGDDFEDFDNGANVEDF
jgi:hypothetical protein